MTLLLALSPFPRCRWRLSPLAPHFGPTSPWKATHACRRTPALPPSSRTVCRREQVREGNTQQDGYDHTQSRPRAAQTDTVRRWQSTTDGGAPRTTPEKRSSLSRESWEQERGGSTAKNFSFALTVASRRTRAPQPTCRRTRASQQRNATQPRNR